MMAMSFAANGEAVDGEDGIFGMHLTRAKFERLGYPFHAFDSFQHFERVSDEY
jgi:hypothetical protein